MLKNNEKYAKNKKKKGFFFVIGVMVCLLIAFVSAVAAFYSSYVDKAGSIASGTLKLRGEYTFLLNGEETDLEDIKNLCPGDVIVIRAQISNDGNNSAWVRDVISFSADDIFLPHLSVYIGEFTQADFRGQGLSVGDYLLQIENKKAVTTNKIIDGSGENAQIETQQDEAYDDLYQYLNASSYQASFTIYFDHNTGNETQGKTFGLSIASQALQFKNNNLFEPDETAWGGVAQ